MKKRKLSLNIFILLILLLGVAFIIASPTDLFSKRMPWLKIATIGLLGILSRFTGTDENLSREKGLYEKYHPKFFKAIVSGPVALIIILRVCNLNYDFRVLSLMYVLIVETLCSIFIQYKNRDEI